MTTRPDDVSLYDVFFDLTRTEMQLWDHIDDALRAEIDVPLGRFEALLVLRRLGTTHLGFEIAPACLPRRSCPVHLCDRESAR